MRSKKNPKTPSSRKQLPANKSSAEKSHVGHIQSQAGLWRFPYRQNLAEAGVGCGGKKVGHLAFEKEGRPRRENVEETWRPPQHKGPRKSSERRDWSLLPAWELAVRRLNPAWGTRDCENGKRRENLEKLPPINPAPTWDPSWTHFL